MDNSASAVEANKFEGLNFGQACMLLFDECKSSAPEVDGFQSLITYVKEIHEALGLEFNLEEYWNPTVVSGSYPVWPAEVMNYNPRLGEVTRESTEALIEMMGTTQRLSDEYRGRVDAASRSRDRQNRSNVTIDPNSLIRAVNTAPTYIPEASEDDEDDFL